MFREWEEWSFGRSRRRGERLGRAKGEPKSALQADKVETSKNYQGKVKSPALQNRGQGTQNRLTIYVRATRPLQRGHRLDSAFRSRHRDKGRVVFCESEKNKKGY